MRVCVCDRVYMSQAVNGLSLTSLLHHVLICLWVTTTSYFSSHSYIKPLTQSVPLLPPTPLSFTTQAPPPPGPSSLAPIKTHFIRLPPSLCPPRVHHGITGGAGSSPGLSPLVSLLVLLFLTSVGPRSLPPTGLHAAPERPHPPAHRPAPRHAVALCVAPRRAHRVLRFLWQRSASRELWPALNGSLLSLFLQSFSPNVSTVLQS